MFEPKEIDVVILCGGLGRRLRKVVNDRPKPMAEIAGEPFLDLLLRYVYRFGFRRFILSTGYKAPRIRDYYHKKREWDIEFCEEKEPLGTGGAVKKVKPFIKSSPFLVINGDSFCGINFKNFLEFHYCKNALVSMALVKNRENRECGYVKLGASSRVTSFNEKPPSDENGLINAGIYLFQRDIFSLLLRENKFSLEYDLFPRLVTQRFYGYPVSAVLIDIGTPRGLTCARGYFKRIKLYKKSLIT